MFRSKNLSFSSINDITNTDSTNMPSQRSRKFQLNNSLISQSRSIGKDSDKFSFKYAYVNNQPQLVCVKNPSFQDEDSRGEIQDENDQSIMYSRGRNNVGGINVSYRPTHNHSLTRIPAGPALYRPPSPKNAMNNVNATGPNHSPNPYNSPRNIDINSREITRKLNELQLRLSVIEGGHRKNQIVRVVEEALQDGVLSVEEKEKLKKMENAVSQLIMNKAERRQLENLVNYNTKVLNTKLEELSRQNLQMNEEIFDLKGKVSKLLPKIEEELSGVGQQYEQFIESHVIKSIEGVNRLGQFYQSELESLSKEIQKIKAEQSRSSDQFREWVSFKDRDDGRIRLLQESRIRFQEFKLKQQSKFKELQAKLQVNLKTNNSSTTANLSQKIGLKCSRFKVNEQVRIVQRVVAISHNSHIPQLILQSSTGSYIPRYKRSFQTSFSASSYVSSSLYSSIPQTLLQEVIYKIDNEYRLLDQHDNYIINQVGQMITLSQENIAKLKANGMML